MKRYGPVLAVDGVGFEIGQGEVVGFLGPNGAGKSTTMKMLTGSLWPDQGRVRIGECDVRTDLAARARLGYLPENTPLYRGMRVARYLEFVAEVKGLAGAARRASVARVLQACDLVGWEDRRIRTLSKGYRQRVGLAQALVADPDVLLLDEPTSGLDPAEIVRIRDLVRELAREKTILLSTHVLSEVQEICRRVIILAGGRLVADGDPLDMSEGGGHSLLVSVAAEAESVRVALRELEGVQRVRALSCDEPDRSRFELEVDPNGEVAPRVAQLVGDRGWPLFELRTEAPSLEQVFLARTGAQPEPEKSA